MVLLRPRCNACGALVLSVCVLTLLLSLGSWERYSHGQGVSVKALLATSLELAERAGAAVLRAPRARTGGHGETESGEPLPVTRADLAANNQLVFGFHKAFPWLRLVSEERPSSPLDYQAIPLPAHSHPELGPLQADLYLNSKDLLVWIDPLDATQELTEGLTDFVSVQICVTFRGSPLLGVVHFPFTNRTLWSWVGFGASAALRAPHNPSENSSKPPSVLISRSHPAQAAARARQLFPNHKVVPTGGAGFKLLALALGDAEAYLHTARISKWDVCAGQALLTSAGGSLRKLDSSKIDYSDPQDTTVTGGILALRAAV